MEPDEEAQEVLRGEQVPQVLEAFKSKIRESEALTAEAAKAMLKQLTKELKLGAKFVFMPVRAALTGRVHGPDLDKIIALLGADNVLKRLEKK